MIRTETPGNRALRSPTERPGTGREKTPAEDSVPEDGVEPEEYVLCRQCREAITTLEDRISIQGAHQHTFANPHGMIFDIGCFRSARGCAYIGPATDEFTWFRGYRWRVAICSRCMLHLGWLFTARGGDNFAGLILERLIFPG